MQTPPSPPFKTRWRRRAGPGRTCARSTRIANDGFGLFLVAAHSERTGKLVRFLVEDLEFDVDCAWREDAGVFLTPLEMAASSGFDRGVRVLLELGASVENGVGARTILRAQRSCHADTVALLEAAMGGGPRVKAAGKD
jgi:hypothetical protein